MHTLFVVCAVVVVVGALVAAYATLTVWQSADQAVDAARRAEQSEVRLKVLRGDVSGLQAHLGTLEQQLRRLQGRVYAQPRRGDLSNSDDPRVRQAGETMDMLGVGVVANSPGTCKCGYCDTCLNGPTRSVQ